MNHAAGLPRDETAPVRGRRRALSDSYDSIVVLCGIVSIGLAFVYWAMRLGFDDPLSPPAKSVALALFIYSFPQTCWWLFSLVARRAGYSPQPSSAFSVWWKSFPFLWLVAIAVTASLGLAADVVGMSAFPVVAALGVLSFLATFVRWIRSSALWRSLVLIVGALAFSVWTAGVVWGRIYKNPLFYENYILDGKVHHDSLYLASLGNMLRTYHVASTGIDGLNYVPYHWGTPWLFAQWSSLIHAHVLDFYQLGFPVTMIPFFFGGTVAFAAAMRDRRRAPDSGEDLRADLRFWFVLLAACVGILPLAGLDAMGVWTSNFLISESYTVAVPCALLMLATVMLFYDRVMLVGSQSPGDHRAGISEWLFAVIVIPLFIVALGYLKISLMLLAFGLALYMLLRLRLYRQPLYLVAGIVGTLLFVGAYSQVSLPAHREGFALFDFLWAFVRPAWWPFFFIIHLFWSWVYVILRLRAEGIGTIADLKEAVSERRILDVEVVAVVAILGLGPGLTTHIDGGSAFYFSDVQRWLAVGLLLSRLKMFGSLMPAQARAARPRRFRNLSYRLDAVSLSTLAVAFLLLPVVGSMVSNAVYWPLRMARANAESRHALYPPSVAAAIPPGLHGLSSLHDAAVLSDGLRRSRNFVVADKLRALSALPLSVRRRTALFIPQDQAVFWSSLTRPGACTFQPFVAPALASLAMVDGMPAYGCVVNRYYGLGSFLPRSRPQTAADAAPTELCRRAANIRLDRVVVLRFDATNQASTTTIECPRPRG